MHTILWGSRVMGKFKPKHDYHQDMDKKRTFKRAFGSSQGGGSRKRSSKYTVAREGKSLLSRSNKLLRTRQEVVLRYHEDITLTPTGSGIPAVYNFSALSLRDPNTTGVGHQPRGFDQMMALYSHYVVNEVCIEVWFQPGGSSSMGFIQLRDTATGLVPRHDAIEYPVMTETLITASNEPSKATLTVKPWQFLGLKKGEDSMKGDTAANPDADCYLCVGVMPMGLVIGNAINAVVKITYKATLLEPTNPVES